MSNRSSPLRLPARLLAIVALAGCASPGTQKAGRAWYGHDFAAAEQALREQLEEEPADRALCLNELGVVALCAGDLDASWRRLVEASDIMESFAGANARELGAIVGQEAAKLWRGDPYEKSLNGWYLGVVNLLRGINDNALAGFKNAVFHDSSRDEQFTCDFAPAWFMEGFAYQRIGDERMAERSFAEARKLAPQCRPLQDPARGNFVLLVDVGQGPTKVAAGAHGEETRFVEHRERPASIEVVIDGQIAGSPEKAGDLHFQATTRGGRAFDAVLEGKSAYKTAASAGGIGAILAADSLPDRYEGTAVLVGIGLLVSAFAVRAEADTRHWTTLPAEVQLFVGDLPPGTHAIELRTSGGWRVLAAAEATVTIPERGRAFAYRRIIR